MSNLAGWRPVIVLDGVIAHPIREWLPYARAEVAGQNWREAGVYGVMLENTRRELVPLIPALEYLMSQPSQTGIENPISRASADEAWRTGVAQR
jgi:hypothetical protein